jgi:hypothetical protein
MRERAETQSNADEFKNCDAKHVFQQVHRELSSTSGSSRSLWLRIEAEIERAGMGGADTYLRSVFSELTQEANKAVDRCREAVKLEGE